MYGKSLIEKAIDTIRLFEPDEGYYLAFSGGKDSVVVKWLTEQSGVKSDAHYRVCPDPPELQRFIRDCHKDTAWDRPTKTMWRMIEMNGYAIRGNRKCCQYMKEAGGYDRFVLTGIRAAESASRKKRHGVTTFWKVGSKRKTLVNPIIAWSDADVWACIHENDIPYCSLYDDGWKRLGCVLCPNSRNVRKEAARWPKIVAQYRRAFHKLYDRHPNLKNVWSSADALFEAWLDRDKSLKGDMREDDCELFSGAGNE